MLMLIAMISGAHLLPCGWLYEFRIYLSFSVAIPIAALIAGYYFSPYVLAGTMVIIDIIFSLLIHMGNKIY